MLINTYVFWQNILSIHQAAFIRALAERKDTKVFCAYEKDLSAIRTKMGWTLPDYGTADICDIRDGDRFNDLCSMNGPEVCHAFGSYFNLPLTYKAFAKLRTAPCRLVWTSEAFNYHGWLGRLRLMRCRWHVLLEAKTFDYVFGMGRLGVDFFLRTGIPNDKVFEFAYLTDPVLQELPDVSSLNSKYEVLFIYAGQLIHRKGIDLMFKAFSRLPKQGWQLLVLGDGPRRSELESLACKLKIDDRVEFLGNQPNLVTQAWMHQADNLVLPSRWDGWGAVVNEALLAGCPAIVSDACGSASLLRDHQRGSIFTRERVDELSALLKNALDRGKQKLKSRTALSCWAHQVLVGSKLVDYFIYIVEADSGLPQKKIPWV